MKNVCFVLHADLFDPWPIARAVREIEVLKKAGYGISAVCWIKGKKELIQKEEVNGVWVHRIFLSPPQRSIIKRIMVYRRAIRKISQKVISLKPQAVVCHDLEILKAGVLAKKSLRIPLFFDAHENWPAMVAMNSALEASYFSFLEKRLLKHVTHSYTYGDDLTEKYNVLGHAATTLYNSKGLDSVPRVNEEDVAKIKQRFGFSESDFIVGFSGSVSLTNGTQQVIEALKGLPLTIKFFVVGGGWDAKDLEDVRKYAEKTGVSDRVIMTGRVTPEELLRYSAVFDAGTALFQPLSENEKARVPNKIFDYMAMGVPMIVSDYPNMRRIVVDESGCGSVVDPMDIKALVNIIKDYEMQKEATKKKGERGRARFQGLYCWDVQKKKLVDSHPLWRGEL